MFIFNLPVKYLLCTYYLHTCVLRAKEMEVKNSQFCFGKALIPERETGKEIYTVALLGGTSIQEGK